MSFNGSGTFLINTAGQPVVTNTVISSTAFNALTADLGTGLSTTITKDGQTTATAKIPFAQGLSAAAASNLAAGTVAAPGLYLSTDTGTGLYRIAANNYGFAVSGAKVLDIASTGLGVTGTFSATGLTLDSSGNLGIGVTPAAGVAGYKGVQIGNAALYGRTGNTTNSEVYVAANSTVDDKYIGNDYAAVLNSNDGAWVFKTAASGTAGNAISWTTVVAISSTGAVVCSAGSGYTFKGAGVSTSAMFSGRTANATDFEWGPDIGASSIWRVQNSGGTGVYLTSGNTAWTANSDERLKDIAGEFTGALDFIVSKVRTVRGTWKADETKRSRSFLIAQDWQEYLPEGIEVSADGILGLTKEDTIPVAFSAIKELAAMVKDLTTRLAALEAK
jgi:hypothetical protein